MAASFPVPAGSIIVVPGGPEHPIESPPGVWPSPGHPAHPIVLPPPPPGIWPPPVGIWPPSPLPPDYPMPPGSIWPSPGVPTHPIAPGGPPPVVGGGPVTPPPQPGHGLPSQKFLVAIVAVSAAGGLEVVGYTVVDPSLTVGFPLPPAPAPKA
jgi:formin 2